MTPLATVVPRFPLKTALRPAFNRDSPDESQTGIDDRVFPVLLQDRREVLTATSTSGNPNAWSRVCDPLLARPALVVESNDALGRAAHVRHNEADAGIKFSGMPLDLGEPSAAWSRFQPDS